MSDGKLFINKINKRIKNNETIHYGDNKILEPLNNKEKLKSVYQKINDIFKSRNYIYKADVIIKMQTGDIEKRIIGRNSNYLMTSEGELIKIEDILDIKRKNS